MKLRHNDISRAHFQGTAQRFILHQTSRRRSSKVWRRHSHIWQFDLVNLIYGEIGCFRRGKHSAALFHKPNQDVRMAVQDDDFVCLSDDDGLKLIDSLLKSKYTAKDMETLGFEESDVESLLLLIRVFRVGGDPIGQYLDVEPALRHAPLIINESGCDTNTKALSAPREKLADKLVLFGRRSPILKRDEETRYRPACMRLSYLAQDRLDLAGAAKHLAWRKREPRVFDFVPLKRAARYLVGEPKAALRFRRQKHVDKITVLRGQRLCWGRSLDEEHDSDQIGNHTVKSGSTLQSLTAVSVGNAEFYAVVKGGQFELSLRSM